MAEQQSSRGHEHRTILDDRRVRHVLAALAVAVFGFLLANVTFLLNFLFFNLIGLVVPDRVVGDRGWRWVPTLEHVLFLAVLLLVSWPILRSRLRTLFKAIYITQPAAWAFATTGIVLNRWPAAVYAVGAVILVGAFVYFRRARVSWLYYYAVGLVGAALVVITTLGVEI